MKKIKGKTWYHESAVCIGGYKADNDLLVIDTGNDDSSARKAVRNFDSINVKYVFNTHSHADHCGGNHYFVKKYNSLIIAPEIEDSFITYTVLEPACFYGAEPPAELKNKFLCATPSGTDIIVRDEEDIRLELGREVCYFKPVSLKGHSPNMYGIITPDNIAFLGDALLGYELIRKHGLIFSFDINLHLKSLERLESLDADGYVLAHGGYEENIDELILLNRKSLEEVSEIILDSLISGSMCFDDIHSFLFNKLGLRENLSLNILNRSIIKAYVKYLHESGKAELFTEKGKTLVRIV